MTIINVAITEGAAELLASFSNNIATPPFISPLPQGLVFKSYGNYGVIWSKKDTSGVRYANIFVNELTQFPPDTSAQEIFARVFRVLKATGKFPIRLPISWSEYHFKSLISFFALPRNTPDAIRWIVDLQESEKAVNFVKLTSSGKTQNLEDFSTPAVPLLRSAVDECVEYRKDAIKKDKENRLVDRVDFEAIGSAAIGNRKTFEEWLPLLNDRQKEIIQQPPMTSVRIVGPAGSGKTLALCLRAIHEIHSAADAGRSVRVLFATHSWTMAEHIDDTLSYLNSGNPVTGITVYPLLQILNDIIGGSMLKGLKVLGDDSTAGRRLQLGYLSDSLQKITPIDRAVLDAQYLSPLHRSALDGDETAKTELLEYLYEEINGVLLADGLIPGDRKKEEEYLSRTRSDDLPPFPSRGDRGLVLLAYRDFLLQLREREFITTDQLVSDATKVLETFAWGVKRESDGFDIIFIDELQLFDAQERFAVALLASSFESTAFVTAEDPSQGVFSSILPSWQKDVPTRVNRKSIELNSPVRFTPAILAFVYRLYLAFPLNAQGLVIEKVEDDKDRPNLIKLSPHDSIASRIKLIIQNNLSKIDRDSRIAIISLDGAAPDLARGLKNAGIPNISEVLSLDDIDKLSYSRRSIVVSEWQFLGGTQFSHVIVVSSHGVQAKNAFSRIRELTALYVASSRAARWLTLVYAGDVHPEVESAVDKGLVQLLKNI
ncbi:UvrD-helicase domain-containing protein [Castellaniella sp.]|uniref:UvrD-helicase domain-containing protein n=1 Tax=Castellaniella sp. TaxID=1955812 RepID=UPI003C755FE5